MHSVSSAIWEGFRSQIRLEPSDLELTMADGSSLEVVGEMRENFTIEDRKFTLNFRVAPLGGLDGLLGLDFLETAKATVDFLLGQFNIGSKQLLKLHKQDSDLCFRIEVASNITVPPRSEMMITGKLKRRRGRICRIHGYGAVENVPSVSRKSEVLVAKSLVSTKTAEFPLPIVNLGDEPVTLH